MAPQKAIDSRDSVTTHDGTVMPSLVARLQKLNQKVELSTTNNNNNNTANAKPTYCLSDVKGCSQRKPNKFPPSSRLDPNFDHEGLVVPHKLIQTKIAAQPFIGDLNKELKFNASSGKSVLNQKSELRKAMDKIQDTRKKREAEAERLGRRTDLELRLEQIAERIDKETS